MTSDNLWMHNFRFSFDVFLAVRAKFFRIIDRIGRKSTINQQQLNPFEAHQCSSGTCYNSSNHYGCYFTRRNEIQTRTWYMSKNTTWSLLKFRRHTCLYHLREPHKATTYFPTRVWGIHGIWGMLWRSGTVLFYPAGGNRVCRSSIHAHRVDFHIRWRRCSVRA